MKRAPEFAKEIAQEFCFAIGFSPQASRLGHFINAECTSGFSPQASHLRLSFRLLAPFFSPQAFH
eukprot:8886350-Lingulodinium_polyedra.AAC.1